MSHKNIKSIEGQRFGNLLVLERTLLKDSQNAYKYMCLCDCGRYKIVLSYVLKRKKGPVTHCGCKNFKPEKRYNRIFINYKKSAIDRNIEFNLTFDQICYLVSQPCHYCGIAYSNKSKTINYRCINKNNIDLLYNGIDRVNNNIGYEINNCVPCCKQCNSAKNILTQQEFINHINTIKLHKVNYSIHSNEINQGFHRIYGQYKYKSKKKNRIFNLTKDQFYKLTQQHCNYCGLEPIQLSKYNGHIFLYNGVDRLNSDIGYEINNCVSCCVVCNKMKLDLTIEDFNEWINRVINYQETNSEN